MERDFAFRKFGYFKPNSRPCGLTVDPLPFEDMTTYPYNETEQYDYDNHTDYIENYQTRYTEGHNSAYGINIVDSNNFMINNVRGSPTNLINLGECGILIVNSDGTIANSTFTDGWEAGGIWLLFSSNCSIINCDVYDNPQRGIYLHGSTDNYIANCDTYNNYHGISILSSSNNNITNCNTYNNNYGIHIYNPSLYNNITNCDVYNNLHGIYLYAGPSNNLIYHNNFVNNLNYNAQSSGNNQWDDGSEGNYWDDYTGVDVDPKDGIGDTPYYIGGGDDQDRYPLMIPIGDTIPPVITDVVATPDTQLTGGYVNITATVTDNFGVDTVKVNITYPDSSTVNVTMSEGSYYYNASYSSIGTYNYFIWANDTSGNENTSDTYQFEITELLDTIPPEITNIGLATSDPLDTNASYGWENVSCTVIDAGVGVDEVKLFVTYPDSSTVGHPMNKNGDTYSYETTLTDVGDYTYHIWANDTSNNQNTSTPETFVLPPNYEVDMDGNRVIGFWDIMAVAGEYGNTGSNGWIREDVDNDGAVGFWDIMAVAGHYGESW